MATRGTRAIDVLQRAGVAFRVHEYAPPPRTGRDRDGRPAYGAEAAAALGVAPERVFKTIVGRVDGRLALAVVPVTAELDLKRFAGALRGRAAELARPADAERATGYVVGGISPLGSRRQLPTVLDASAAAQPTILLSGGRRGVQVELAPADLVSLHGAEIAAVARTDGRWGVVNRRE